MASTPMISNTVNGYSRYDVPENVAFSATPGILYVARCDFMNSRDVVNIQAGGVIRANPTTVPTFTPYQVRLHRFFVPMQLYHAAMRVNSSRFDMRDLSLNYYPISQNWTSFDYEVDSFPGYQYIDTRSLVSQLALANGLYRQIPSSSGNYTVDRSYPAGFIPQLGTWGFNADPLIAYWDIVRNYYSFSQVSQFSLAFPVSRSFGSASGNFPVYAPAQSSSVTPSEVRLVTSLSPNCLWQQFLADLEPLDNYYESAFYPRENDTRVMNALALPVAICQSAFGSTALNHPTTIEDFVSTFYRANANQETYASYAWMFTRAFPSAVVPSSPDRLSRLLPFTASDSVSLTNVQTITQLALAARLQEYKDLLGAGGSRFTDWLMTFFAAKVSHVDRPLLVYSSSFYLNSSPIFNQAGSPGDGLGAYGGVLQGMDDFGKKSQRYCFDEPGYLMDLVSIRPLYYWSGLPADYAYYDGMDYFNPTFNQVGYQTVPASRLGLDPASSNLRDLVIGREPCYNEFRASYDRVFGSLAVVPGLSESDQPDTIYNSWVMQRNPFDLRRSDVATGRITYMELTRFVSMADVNRPFVSSREDNFFVNLYYRVTRKSLVSKNFATKLAIR